MNFSAGRADIRRYQRDVGLGPELGATASGSAMQDGRFERVFTPNDGHRLDQFLSCCKSFPAHACSN